MKRYGTQLHYTVLQGSYWMQFCAVIGYSSVFLLAKDFSNSQIGMVMALGGILGAVSQPAVAGFADRSRRVELKTIIAVLGFAGFTLSALLFAAPALFLVEAGLYGLLIALSWVIQPLINAVGMEFMNRGVYLNYGLARGVGSFAYAAVSYLMGYLVKRTGEAAVPAALILLFLVLAIAALFLKTAGGNTAVKEEVRESVRAEKNGRKGVKERGFFSSYKLFFVLLLGVACVFICHNILNNYLFQIMESLGGGADNMGFAMALSAVVEIPAMFLFQRIVRRIESRNLLRIAAVFFTVKAAATLFAGNIYVLYGVQVIQMTAFALFVPASVYYVNELIRPRDRVKGQAFMTVTNTVGGVIGSLLGGYMLDHQGVRGMLTAALVISAAGTLLMVFSVQRAGPEWKGLAKDTEEGGR